MKLKATRKHDNEKYKFVNGIAKVPGVWFMGRQMLITIKEFNELDNEATR